MSGFLLIHHSKCAPTDRVERYRAHIYVDSDLIMKTLTPAVTLAVSKKDNVVHCEDRTVFAIGEINRRQGDRFARVHKFTYSESRALNRTQGRVAAELFCGRYIIIVVTGPRDIVVMRDPISNIQVFFGRTSDGDKIFFSKFSKASGLLPAKLSLNHDYIARYFTTIREVSNDTGFREISKLCGGQACLVSEGRMSLQWYWNPCHFARKAWKESQNETNLILRKTLESVLLNQAESEERILVRLSGGLDSSLIAAVIAEHFGSSKIVAYNYYVSKSRASDERIYAEAVCDQWKIPLICQELRTTPADIVNIHAYAPSPVPSALYIARSSWRSAHELAHVADCSVIWDGHGGDQLFGACESTRLINDHIQDNGIGLKTLRILKEVSRLLNQPLPLVAMRALKEPNTATLATLLQGSLAVDKPFVSSYTAELAARQALSKLSFFDEPIPVGKTGQVFGILWSQLWSNPMADSVIPSHHPLMHQALVELCLQIPSYMLSPNGRSRGAIRAAAAGLIPEAVRTRVLKGTTERPSLEWFHSPKTRSMLLDGLLVQYGFLDRPKLEWLFSTPQFFDTKQQVLEVLQVEIWLQSMQLWL